MTNKNLILTRKVGRKIVIHDGNKILCTLTVTAVGSSQCKLGFEASSDIKIDREEVYNNKLIQEV
jgi:carbon storage regulator CsrA